MGPGSGYWPPKLLSLREETPLLALPDRVELLPPRADWGLVGEPGIGWRGDWTEREERGGVMGMLVSITTTWILTAAFTCCQKYWNKSRWGVNNCFIILKLSEFSSTEALKQGFVIMTWLPEWNIWCLHTQSSEVVIYLINWRVGASFLSYNFSVIATWIIHVHLEKEEQEKTSKERKTRRRTTMKSGSQHEAIFKM